MKRVTEWFLNKQHKQQGDVYAALDVGSSKIACFIARTDSEGVPRVIGVGHHISQGMRHGSIANMDALQQAISSAVESAEMMSGEMIKRVAVNIVSSHLYSQTVDLELPLNGRDVTESDLNRVITQGQALAMEEAQGQALELIHTLPVHYAVDNQKGIRDPIGITGSSLHTQLHLVSAAFGPARTLVTTIARCHLEVEKLVAGPYASGVACLVEDEMDLGCLIIDMGAGTTGLGVFFDGSLVYTDGVPVGGAHVTNDIARGLTTSVAHAERLKTLYGNAILSSMDEREIIEVPLIGEEAPENASHLPKSHLIRIIQPRLEETFEMVKAKMDKSGFQEAAGRRVVITGGASQLPGVRELAQRILDKQVRLGRPLRVARGQSPSSKNPRASFASLDEATSGPAFSATAGLLALAMQNDPTPSTGMADFVNNGGGFNRTLQWMRRNM